MKKLFASVAAVAVALPLAASAGNFTGFYAGVGLGANAVNGTYQQTANSGAASGTSVKNDIGKTLFDGALFGGYGKMFGQFYVGGELALALSGGGINGNISGGNLTYKVTPGWSVSPSVRLGFLAAPQTLAFVRLGATDKRFEVKADPIGTNTTQTKKSQNVWGFTTGVGMETFISEKVSLRGEYIFTAYANKSYAIGTTDTAKLKARDNLFRLGVSYNF